MLIKKIALSKLLKLEIPQLAKGILDIVENHDPESLLIENAFDDFNLLKPEIESLIVRYGPHPVTEQLEPLRHKRILFATAISFQVKGLVKGYIDGSDNDVRTAKEAVNRYLHNLRANNEEVINEKVEQFLNEVQTNTELSDAMSALGFLSYIDNLESVHLQLMKLIASRNASISRRVKGGVIVASKTVREGLSILFNRITAATYNNKELDYKPLIDELNEKLIRYSGLIKTRETAQRTSSQSPSNEGEMEAPTSMMFPLRVTTVNGDDFDNNQNQKKAAAPFRELMQLPPTDNEA